MNEKNAKKCTCKDFGKDILSLSCPVHHQTDNELLKTAADRAKLYGPQILNRAEGTVSTLTGKPSMTSDQFVCWLKGMVLGLSDSNPTPRQWLTIRDAVMGVDLSPSGDSHAS